MFFSKRMIMLVSVFAVGIFIGVGSVAVWQQKFPVSYRQVINQTLPSVVSIYGNNRGEKGRSIGAGVIISDGGHVMTNYHLIANLDFIEIELHNGEVYEATLIGIDPAIDIAFLVIDADNLPAIRSRHSHLPEAGDVVFAIGNPFGLNRSATMGIVSAIGRDKLGLYNFEQFIQTDAAINPGSSGGPLVDAEGTLIGINSALFYRQHGITPQGIGFAIPADVVLRSYRHLIGGAPSRQNVWGVEVRVVPERLLQTFAKADAAPPYMVSRLWPNALLGQVDVQVGDLIVNLNDEAPADYIQSGTLVPDIRSMVVLRGETKLSQTLPTIYPAGLSQ